ncbi:helix-turn-helix domain-containing protein [Orenia marismortui]|uniref:HRDC domain-containing protein n=1 Tax=Orenia marismortui TaxID=46469 RepID=A0A4R8HAC3_9FIRM|nr:helix-turn-helix domain-containing protein [Orenia marismortui]TDX53243.1 HRDC domain-containing protein [Orenia marismortui]
MSLTNSYIQEQKFNEDFYDSVRSRVESLVIKGKKNSELQYQDITNLVSEFDLPREKIEDISHSLKKIGIKVKGLNENIHFNIDILESKKKLFLRLKAIREELINRGLKRVPGVSDENLKRIVRALPTQKHELLLAPKMGKTTYQKFGLYFLKELRSFAEKYKTIDKNIESLLPDDYKKLLHLQREGISLDEVSKETSIDKGRIAGILAKLMRADIIDDEIENLVSKEKYLKIKDAMDTLINTRFKSIRKYLKYRVSYDHIKLVVAYEEDLSDEDFDLINDLDPIEIEINSDSELDFEIGELNAKFDDLEIKNLDSAIKFGLKKGYVKFDDLLNLDYEEEEVNDHFEAMQIIDGKNIEISYD